MPLTNAAIAHAVPNLNIIAFSQSKKIRHLPRG
jgi:hypothetical protein